MKVWKPMRRAAEGNSNLTRMVKKRVGKLVVRAPGARRIVIRRKR